MLKQLRNKTSKIKIAIYNAFFLSLVRMLAFENL